jgi:excisionase family DNA binding protein
MPENPATNVAQRDQFITTKDAASQLGIHEWALRRAIKRGDVPGYRAFNGRIRVRLPEVIAVIEASKQ